MYLKSRNVLFEFFYQTIGLELFLWQAISAKRTVIVCCLIKIKLAPTLPQTQVNRVSG